MSKFDTGTIRSIYYYLAATIGLIVFIIGAIGMTNFVVKRILDVREERQYEWMYSECSNVNSTPLSGGIPSPIVADAKPVPRDQEDLAKCKAEVDKKIDVQVKEQIKNELTMSLAPLIIGFFVWLFHWSQGQKDRKSK